LDADWTDDLAAVRGLFSKLQMRGTTPTGPAIMGVLHYYQYGNMKKDSRETEPEIVGYIRGELSSDSGKGGIFGDYVV
jgi:Ca-activated chloride channel family protein